jgi:hypothetical protein
MWNAISYVTGGFTLIAFITAAGAFIWLRLIRRDEVALSRASPSDIPAILDRIARQFHIDTASLTKEQKHGIVLEQLRLQSERFRLALRGGLIALFLLTVLTAFTVWIASNARYDPNALPEPHTDRGTAEAKVKLLPRSFNMTATLEATTKAHISDGGSAELKVIVNDAICNEERVYKNWSSGPIFTITTTCSVPVLANTKYVFRAVQSNYNADAHETNLKVTYQR